MRISTIVLSFMISQSALAGINGLTHHSRANCANNESISWDLLENHVLRVDSHHIYLPNPNINTNHSISTHPTQFSNTWRAAAVHWGEGGVPGTSSTWGVAGNHFMQYPNGEIRLVAQEYVTDCSIYDGWWDFDHKKLI